MKLITLNTHSLEEPEYERKLELLAQVIIKEQPDVIALQEVNQTITRSVATVGRELGYLPCEGARIPLKEDNYALGLARLLRESGCRYWWTWAPAKVGYEI